MSDIVEKGLKEIVDTLEAVQDKSEDEQRGVLETVKRKLASMAGRDYDEDTKLFDGIAALEKEYKAKKPTDFVQGLLASALTRAEEFSKEDKKRFVSAMLGTAVMFAQEYNLVEIKEMKSETRQIGFSGVKKELVH